MSQDQWSLFLGVGIPLGLFLFGLVHEYFIAHYLLFMRMRNAGRYLRLDEALRRVRAGHGMLVENRTNLPGRVWWRAERTDSKSPTEVLRPAYLCTRSCLAPFKEIEDLPESAILRVDGVILHPREVVDRIVMGVGL